MKLDSANRSFVALVVLAVVPYALLGLLGCGVLSLVVYRVGAHGLSGLTQDGQDLRPAALFFALITSGTVVAGLSVRRQVLATRRLADAIASQSKPLPSGLAQIADAVGLAGRVDLWADARPCSFTYGLFSPRVAVSHGLLDAVGDEELAAVLHHEQYHVRNRDTLKVVVARAAPSAFFFLPVLRALRDRYLAARELAADRRAVRAVGERHVAGALYKALDAPDLPDLGAAAALGGRAFLDARVEQLEAGTEPSPASLSRPAVAGTVIGLAVLTVTLALAVTNGGSDGGMSMDESMGGGGLGIATSAVGWRVCIAGWAVGGYLLVVRRARRHHRPA